MCQSILLVVLLGLSFSVLDVSAACNLKFNKTLPGVYISNVGRYQIIADPYNGTVQIDTTAILDAYCASGFKNYATAYTTKLENHLRYSCSGTAVRYQVPGSSITYSAKSDGTVTCESPAQYYTETVKYCKNTGLVYGLNVGNSSVVFGEICYDFRNYRADFVHYVAGVRNNYVEDQYYFNPGNKSNSLLVNKTYTVNSAVYLKEVQNLPTALRLKTGNYAQIMNYYIYSLIPIEYSAGVLARYVSSFRHIGAIPYWNHILDFNFRQVESLINSLSASGWYDVYTGTSNSLIIPYENRNETFSYEANSLNRTIPMYVWNMVKKNDNKDTGVVVIGVNSPFFPGDTSKTVLCKDMCDKVTWLNPLKNTRKIASLGYVFCCETKDVKSLLTGFPQI